jgi:iron complex outermembrane receptor protein
VLFRSDSLARGYPGTFAALHKYHDILCQEQKAAQGWGTCDLKGDSFPRP